MVGAQDSPERDDGFDGRVCFDFGRDFFSDAFNPETALKNAESGAGWFFREARGRAFGRLSLGAAFESFFYAG